MGGCIVWDRHPGTGGPSECVCGDPSTGDPLCTAAPHSQDEMSCCIKAPIAGLLWGHSSSADYY